MSLRYTTDDGFAWTRPFAEHCLKSVEGTGRGRRKRFSCSPYAKMKPRSMGADLSIRPQMPDSYAFRTSNAMLIGE
jgi:hypothetical protein